MVIYADTSYLVSLYGQDANSPTARRLVVESGLPLVYTDLQRHETRNAFRLAVFRGEMSISECDAVLDIMETDVRHGVLCMTLLASTELYQVAETLSAAHSASLGTRSADVLHVAAALALHADSFLTFDKRQASLALAAGLKCLGC